MWEHGIRGRITPKGICHKQQYLKRKELETERCPIVVPTCKTKKRRRQEDQYPNYNNYTTISRAAPPPLSNHYNHVRQNNAYNFFASATTATTNRHYSAPAAASNFDPMVAPLPPPYDFTGPIPSFSEPRFSEPRFSEPRFSEPPELPPEPSSGSRGYTNTTAVANTSGVSASDPICIDWFNGLANGNPSNRQNSQPTLVAPRFVH